jgi:hypothetical protein
MKLRCFSPVLAGLVLLFAYAVLSLHGQSPAPPAYSVTEVSMMTVESMFSGRESSVKVLRNGPKELLDVTILPWEANSKGRHTAYLVDLQAHKVYMHDMVRNSCSWMRYVSEDVPNYDPLSQSGTSPAELAKMKSVGTETINGIPTKIVEAPMPPDQGKSRIWIAEKGGFLVKAEWTQPDGKVITMLEVKQVNFTKPADSFFVPPSNCETQAQGEMSSSGFSGHGEAQVEASGTVSTDLKTKETQGEITVRTGGEAASQGNPKPAPAKYPWMGATETNAQYRVTTVQLHLVPDHYTAPCPGKVQLVGEITTDGPGTVWYRFLAGAVSHSPEGTVTFIEAGTKTVSLEGTITVTPRVPNAALLAIMEDKQGNHGPLTITSGPVNYNITCTGQVAPAH